MNIQIVPAILATTEKEYRDKLSKIEAAPELKNGWVQIDLMDERFVQNKSIGVDVMASNPTSLKIEAQLMVEYPENWIDELIKVKVGRIVFPIEDDEGILERIKHIKNHNIEVGLSLNPETEVGKLMPFVSTIDSVLIMSVQPGFGGQEFIKKSIEKVREVAKLKTKQSSLKIGVDGGVGEEIVKDLVDSGADYLVIGSHLIDGGIAQNLSKIRKAIYKGS